jgi:hypothetical protein
MPAFFVGVTIPRCARRPASHRHFAGKNKISTGAELRLTIGYYGGAG